MKTPTPEAELASILDDIYEAALDASRWRPLTARLAAIFGGNAVLFSQDSLTPAAFVFETAGFENSFVASYADHYAATNVWMPGVAVQPDGAIVTGDEIIGRREFEQTEWYNDWLRPQGLYHGTGAVLANERGLVTQFSIIRPDHAGPLNQAEIAKLRLLVPHLRRGIKLHGEMSAARNGTAAAMAGFERLDTAAFLVDALGRLRFANPPAEQLLTEGTALRAPCGVLTAVNKDANEGLRAVMRGSGGMQPSPCGGTIALPRPLGRPLIALVTPYRAAAAPVIGAPAMVLILVRDPQRAPQVDAAALRSALGLTQAEAATVALLAGGLSPAEIATRSQVSIETVRTHIKRSMVKAEVTRHADLVSLAIRSGGFRMNN